MFSIVEKSIFKVAMKKLGKWLLENKNGKLTFDVNEEGLKKANEFMEEYGFTIERGNPSGFDLKFNEIKVEEK